MIKEIPMLFSTPMVIAADNEIKTMTRRTRGLKQANEFPDDWKFLNTVIDPEISVNEDTKIIKGKGLYALFSMDGGDTGIHLKCPYGQKGDRIWVRETWTKLCPVDENGYTDFNQELIYYLAQGVPDITIKDADGFEEEDQRIKWKPCIHMKKEHARIWLEITDIYVERLRDISEEDAIAEGVETLGLYPGYDVSSRGKFEGLWGMINGTESWDANPWVWVVKFKKLTKK